MGQPPTNQEIALEVGLSEEEVQQYRRETYLLKDGSWLIHFAFHMPKPLRERLTGSFTLILKPLAGSGERRRQAL